MIVRRINRWLVLCFMLSSLATRACKGKSSFEIPGELANQMLNLKKGYRYKFMKECFLGDCDLVDMTDVNKRYWKSETLKERGHDKFWYTYKCTVSGDSSACPVDGGWSSWREWGPCTVTCDVGIRVRHRQCNKPLPKNGGNYCIGEDTEVTDCHLQKCMSIGGDIAPHQEATIKLAAKSVQQFHEADPELIKDCWIGHCTYGHVLEAVTPKNLATSYWTNLNCFKYATGCPLDGGWSEWGLWSTCSSGCGEGRANRRRYCNNPTPMNGGALCKGPLLEDKKCFDDRCRNTVGPLLTPWSEWSECSVKCGLGVKVSGRRCTNTIVGCPDGSGNYIKQLEKTAPCYIPPCETQVAGDDGWTPWSEWSPCSTTCGQAFKERYRVCIQLSGGKECEGEETQQMECDLNPCPALMENWNTWSTWTGCSSDCNGGIESRERTCVTKDHTTSMINGCVGEFVQTIACNLNLCSVNGLWANWASWSECSQFCNPGVEFRDRTCTDPAPAGNGTTCDGIGTELRQCYQRPCPESSAESRVFRGSSYLFYPATATPTRLLFIYVRFKSFALDGVLLMRKGPGRGMPVLAVGLINAYVELYLKIGSSAVKLMASQIRTSEWNTLEVAVVSNRVSVRVNDAQPVNKEVAIDNPGDVNLDQEMYVGGVPAGSFPKAMKQNKGFYGTVADVRVNYKDYSLEASTEWLGPGTPMTADNVGREQTDIEALLPYFDGNEHTKLSLPSTAGDPKVLHVTIILRPDNLDGIILHNNGKIPGSFIVMSLRNGNLELFIRDGITVHSIRVGKMEIRKWYIISILFEGQEGEVRLNYGPAAQINTQGKPYIPSREIHIGGVSKPDNTVTELLTHNGVGMTGVVYKVTFNSVEYMMKDSALLNLNAMLNSASTTLAAHYEEKFVVKHSSVKLRCDYGMFLSGHMANLTIKWLKESSVLEISDHIKVVEKEPLEPYTSTLHLHYIDEEKQGMYSCLVHYNGIDIITHAFGIVLHVISSDWLEGSALGSLILLCIFLTVALATILLIVVSCITCFRHRVRCLQSLYSSLGHFVHFGNYDVKHPNVNIIDQVNKTFTEDFSPSEAVKVERKRAEQREKEKQKKGHGSEKTSGKKRIFNPISILKRPKEFFSKMKKVSIDDGKKSAKKKTDQSEAGKTSVAIEISPSASVVTRNVLPQPASTPTTVASHREQEVMVDVARKPSESLSREEIAERRLSHTMLTGNSSSSSDEDDTKTKKAKIPPRPTVDTSRMFGRRKSSSGAANMLATAIIRSQTDLENVEEDY
ncbi:uncharacterized protein [Ptychodera flava]